MNDELIAQAHYRLVEALAATERSARLRLENLREVVFETDSRGRLIFVNRAWSELLRHEPSKSLGFPFLDFINPQDRGVIEDRIRALGDSSEHSRVAIELSLRRGDGSWMPVEMCLSPTDEGGMVGSFNDLTQRKLAEEGVQRHASLLGAVAEASRILLTGSTVDEDVVSALGVLGSSVNADRAYIFEWHDSGDGTGFQASRRFEWANSNGLALSGRFGLVDFRPGLAIPRWVEFMAAGQPLHGPISEFPSSEQKVLKEQGIESIVLCPIQLGNSFWGFVGFDDCRGPRRWNQAEIDTIRAMTGPFGGVIMRERASQTLRESNERLRAVFHGVQSGIFLIDPIKKVILDANPTAAVLCGLSKTELKGTPCHQIFVGGCSGGVCSGRNSGSSIEQMEATLLHSSGRHVPILKTMAQTQIGGRVFLLASFIDISDRKRAENALREASELKSRFISMTSHEFRTPISAIQLAIDLLQEPPSVVGEGRRQELFQRVEFAVQRMKRMLDAVIAVSRAESGKMPFQPRLLDVASVVAGVVEECRYGEGQNHQIRLECSQSPCMATVDPDLLWNVLINLLRNASMYSRPRTVILVELSQKNGELRLSVSDQGIGIPLQDQPRVFGMFERGSNVGHSNGTGLGLNIVQRLTALHGGSVSFTSEPGVGTTFTLLLPVDRPSVTI